MRLGKTFSIFFFALWALFSSSITYAQGEITLNFRNTNVRSIIESVAKLTNKTVLIDPRVNGNVTIVANNSLPKEKAFDALLLILSLYGFDAVETEYATLILPAQVSSTIASKNKGIYDFERVTEIIAVTNVPVSVLTQVLQPFLGQQARLQVVPGSNRIIVSDSNVNLKRIKTIIKEVDRVSITEFDTVQVVNNNANDVLRIVRSIYGKNPLIRLELDERTNRILILSDSLETRLAVRGLIAELDIPIEGDQTSANLEVFYLKYAKAKNIAQLISNLLSSSAFKQISIANDAPKTETDEKAPKTTNFSSQQDKVSYSIQADDNINAVIVAGNAQIIQTARLLIDNLDLPRLQLVIELIIAELSDEKFNELGLNFYSAGKSGAFSTKLGPATFDRFSTAFAADSPSIDSVSLANAAGQQGGSTSFAGANISGDSINWAFLLEAIDRDSNSHILSTPFISVLDNEEAEISVGEERPFVTGSFTKSGDSNTPFQTFERKNVGITFKVLPQINGGDAVQLDIDQEISSASNQSDAQNLVTSKRTLKTKLIAKDGEVIALGGLKQVTENVVNQKIPLLGDIPYLGVLFRYSSTKINSQNLVMFIRPTILGSREDIDSFSRKKYSDFRKNLITAIANDTSTEVYEEFSPEVPSINKRLPQRINYLDEPSSTEILVPEIIDESLTSSGVTILTPQDSDETINIEIP